MHYVTDEEYAALTRVIQDRMKARRRVSIQKKLWREGQGANMTLAEKLAVLRKAAGGKVTI